MKCYHKPTLGSFIKYVDRTNRQSVKRDKNFYRCKKCGKRILMITSHRKIYRILSIAIRLAYYLLFFVFFVLFPDFGLGEQRKKSILILIFVYLFLNIGLDVFGLLFAKYKAVKAQDRYIGQGGDSLSNPESNIWEKG